MALRLLALMVVLWAGFGVGGSGVESLFFARFGPRNLPYMYMALGLLTLLVTQGVSVLLGRADRRRILVLLPVAMAGVVISLRALVEIRAGWVYPALWLAMMVVWIVQGITAWGLAGMVHDARQAKRLFPLYGAGIILGGALGGLLTRPLVGWVGAENLLVVWAASLVVAVPLARAGVGAARKHRHRWLRGHRVRGPALLEQIREGGAFVRRSPLLRRMAVAMVLLGLLYFALSLPFAEAATARFPDADRLAGFLGIFTGATYAAGLAASLLLANRLYARVGIPAVVLSLPFLYLGVFATAAAAPTFVVLVAFRFTQLAWMYGVWNTAWQALFNVVPPDRREQARTFMDGAAMQAGIVLAGALLLVARSLPQRVLFTAGAVVAAAAVAAAARARASYSGAVGDALRAGWPEVFVREEEPFGGIAWDREALVALERGAHDPEPAIRRIAMEILAELPLLQARILCSEGLTDQDPGVRAAALRGMTRSPNPRVLPEVMRLLSDPDPAVRAVAADAAVACSVRPGDAAGHLRPLLEDPDPSVRVRAGAALHRVGDPSGLEALSASADGSEPTERSGAVRALAELGELAELVAGAIDDPDPSVRLAGASSLPSFGSVALEPLISALGDEEPSVRQAAADALASLGDDAVGPVEDALQDGRRDEGALLALGGLPIADPEPIRRYAEQQRVRALRYHEVWRGLEGAEDDRVALLAHAVRRRALEHATRSMRAQGILGDRTGMELALESLGSRDPNQRATALEMLEAATAREAVTPLLGVWEPEPGGGPDGAAAIEALIEDDDPWIRACAALAAPALDGGDVMVWVAALVEADPDATVRDAAARALEEGNVETLSTLSLMDRVMALRKVPLFREVSPADLKRVAEAATEHVFPDGTVIAEQGDRGEAMYVVVSGDVRVLVDEASRVHELIRRGPGYIVGEMAVLTGEPRMASLVAAGDVRTLAIDRARFQRILRERPDAALAVLRELCYRLQEVHATEASGG